MWMRNRVYTHVCLVGGLGFREYIHTYTSVNACVHIQTPDEDILARVAGQRAPGTHPSLLPYAGVIGVPGF